MLVMIPWPRLHWSCDLSAPGWYSCRKQFACRPEDRGLRNILETLKQLFVWLTGFKMFTKHVGFAGPSQAHWGQIGPIPIGTTAFPPCHQFVQPSRECRTAGLLQLPVSGVWQHTPSQRCDVPAPSKRPQQQQHRFTSETSQEWHQCVACQGLFVFLLAMLLCGHACGCLKIR